MRRHGSPWASRTLPLDGGLAGAASVYVRRARLIGIVSSPFVALICTAVFVSQWWPDSLALPVVVLLMVLGIPLRAALLYLSVARPSYAFSRRPTLRNVVRDWATTVSRAMGDANSDTAETHLKEDG